MLVQGCVGEEGNHGNETIIYFVLLRLGICYSINPWFAVRWEISVGFCILEPLKNGGCQQLLYWRLLQESCYWLSSILHIHHAHKIFVKQCFLTLTLLAATFIFSPCGINEIIKSEFKNICYKYETPWWMFPWNCGRGRKTIYVYIKKGF